MKRRLGVFVFVLMFTLGMATGAQVQKVSQEKTRDEVYEKLEVFTDALVLIQQNYVDDVGTQELIHGALKGMLSSLDKYSEFLTPEDYQEMEVQTKGEFGGLGIEIGIRDDVLTIIAPIEDTPAYKAGLTSGDKIVKIGGELTRDMRLTDAVGKMRGEKGTEVTITIWREKENGLFDVTIVRDKIEIKGVREARIFESDIGYIKLTNFNSLVTKELDEALTRLNQQGMKALIIDVRNNPGGLLNAAVEAAERFIPEGRVIVTTGGKENVQHMKFTSSGGHTQPEYPIVILINQGSASASEILSGALQDHKRAILVGMKTFGKGSVQTVIPLKDGSALRLTTSRYFTPDGRQIHNIGVVPDIRIELKENPPEKEETLDIFEKLNIEEKLKIDEMDAADEKPKIRKKELYDNQLSGAVDILKGIIVYKASLPIEKEEVKEKEEGKGEEVKAQ